MFAYEYEKHKILPTFQEKVKLQRSVTQKVYRLGMWSFQSITAFIRTQTCKEIFRSALVRIIALLRKNNGRTLTGNI